VDLPADLGWASPGAVVVEDREEEGRRRLRLATARGAETVLDLRRKVDSAEAERLLAQTVALTLVQLRPEGPRRHDVVLYEVRRGGLEQLSVELPPGLEVEQAATDEGVVVPVVEGASLTVHRRRRLQGVGYLVLTSTPREAAGDLALEAVIPGPEVRARYLAISASVAADARPLPAESWARVDLADLPAVLSEALAALDLGAAWRLAGDGAGARLALAPLPPAPTLDAAVRRRDTTALLTVDGTLLFRDVFVVESRSRAGAALDLLLPAGATLWSAKVDGQPVRPLERNGSLSVPLGSGAGARSSVEVVSVLERALPPGRSQLALDLPRVALPVLDHRLRLLLPETARYRFRGGDLRPAPAVDPWAVLRESPGTVTDRIHVGRAKQAPAAPPPPEENEKIEILAESPLLDERRPGAGSEVSREELDRLPTAKATTYREVVQGLQQGLVGGVKPLPVSVPESGKLLVLTGVLPPERITLEMDVKAKR
jgi:hypothetical protein